MGGKSERWPGGTGAVFAEASSLSELAGHLRWRTMPLHATLDSLTSTSPILLESVRCWPCQANDCTLPWESQGGNNASLGLKKNCFISTSFCLYMCHCIAALKPLNLNSILEDTSLILPPP
jgi:hypothetical protein